MRFGDIRCACLCMSSVAGICVEVKSSNYSRSTNINIFTGTSLQRNVGEEFIVCTHVLSSEMSYNMRVRMSSRICKSHDFRLKKLFFYPVQLHLGKQAVVCFIIHQRLTTARLSLLSKNSKDLILWVLEAKVLLKSEVQYLALLLPAIRLNMKAR